MVNSTIRTEGGGSSDEGYNNRNRSGKRRLRSARSRRQGSGSIQEATGSQPAAGVHEPATAVFGGPGSLQQRTLVGSQDRAVRSSSKTYESAVCKALPEKR